MSHVPVWAKWPEQCFREGNIMNDSEINRYTGHGLVGSSVEIRGFLLPAPNFHIVWRRNGKLQEERVLSESEHIRVMRAITDGRFAFVATGPQDQFYLEVVPVEYDCIWKRMEPNRAWRGLQEVA